jgi:hypothetical protein
VQVLVGLADAYISKLGSALTTCLVYWHIVARIFSFSDLALNSLALVHGLFKLDLHKSLFSDWGLLLGH